MARRADSLTPQASGSGASTFLECLEAIQAGDLPSRYHSEEDSRREMALFRKLDEAAHKESQYFLGAKMGVPTQ